MEDMFEGIKRLMQMYQADLDQMAKIVKESIEELPISVSKLADQGWYTLLEMAPGETHYLAHQLSQGNIEEVDLEMIELI